MSNVVALTVKVGRFADALRFDAATIDVFDRTIGPPIRDDILAVARRAFGPDGRPFKNKPTSTATVTVESRVTASGYAIEFRLGPKGVWVFGQYGAGPHDIRPAKMKMIRAPGDHPFLGPVHHPGTKGKRAIDGAYKAIRSRQHELVAEAYARVKQAAFNG